ncbi:MAG: hypothetical protein JNM80_00545 [Phycisphaerae bacterium]|nr:hypothetical protein [Phycisphaerae bacterium]
MPLSRYLMSRAEYDAHCRERFEEAYPNDPEAVARAMQRRYPATTEQAVEELKRRGLRIDPEQLNRRAACGARQVGRSYVWYPNEIDEVAEDLDQANKLTYDAHWRREQGLSYAEHAAIRKQVQAKRLAVMQRVADVAGGTIPDVADACNRLMPDPLEWDDAAIAKAVALTREYIPTLGVTR